MSTENKVISPLSDASTSEIDTLVDEVLRSGKHHALPAGASEPGHDSEDRLHAKVIAGQMQRLAHQLSADGAAAEDGPDDVDEWWFELDEKRIGPISLRKVRFLWEEGELTPDSLCWHEGFSSWVSLFQVSELAEALAPRSGGGLKAASRVELPREETIWQPNAGATLESDNRKRLKEAHPLGLSEGSEAANDDRTVDSYVGTHTTLPALQQPAAAPPRVGFAHSLVSGLVAGVVVAAAVIGTRVFWPEHAPQQPVVVVVRDEPKSPPPKLTRATPVREEPKTREPTPAPKPVAPKPAAKVAPKAEHVPPVAPAATVVADPPKPETVDDQFAKAFTPPDELETSEIFEVVANHQAQVDACVRAQKAASPDLSGRVVMRWSVALDGSVSDVTGPSGDFADAPITTCLAKAIPGWKFPKHEVAHGPVDVPFVF